MRTTGPGQSARLLLDAVDILSRENIRYAVIGAMAASVHGIVRASLDADVVLSSSLDKLRQLQVQFQLDGLNTELRRGAADDPIPALLTINDKFGNRVDLLAGIRGLEVESFSRSIDVPFQGTVLRVIGKEDFIAMKVFAGGPLDLDDAKHAIALAGNSIDLPLLRRLTQQYGAEASKSFEKLLDQK